MAFHQPRSGQCDCDHRVLYRIYYRNTWQSQRVLSSLLLFHFHQFIVLLLVSIGQSIGRKGKRFLVSNLSFINYCCLVQKSSQSGVYLQGKSNQCCGPKAAIRFHNDGPRSVGGQRKALLRFRL